jgi:hypothetical protein
LCWTRWRTWREWRESWPTRTRSPACRWLSSTRDELVHLAGYGLRQMGNEKAPVGEDTVFQLASLSKPLAAMAS